MGRSLLVRTLLFLRCISKDELRPDDDDEGDDNADVFDDVYHGGDTDTDTDEGVGCLPALISTIESTVTGKHETNTTAADE